MRPYSHNVVARAILSGRFSFGGGDGGATAGCWGGVVVGLVGVVVPSCLSASATTRRLFNWATTAFNVDPSMLPNAISAKEFCCGFL